MWSGWSSTWHIFPLSCLVLTRASNWTKSEEGKRPCQKQVWTGYSPNVNGLLSTPNPALGRFPSHIFRISHLLPSTPDPKGHCRNATFRFGRDVFYTLWTSPGNTLISEKPNVGSRCILGSQDARGPCNATHSHILTFSMAPAHPLKVLLQLLFKDASFSLWHHWNLLLKCFYIEF